MNQRQEIIERLKALELEGGSHQMLSDICRAVAPGAKYGWTQGACDGLRLRLISFLSETDEDALREAYMKGRNDGFDRGFASADDWCAQHEDAMAEHGWYRVVDADKAPIRFNDDVEWELLGSGETESGRVVGIKIDLIADRQNCRVKVVRDSDFQTIELMAKNLHHVKPDEPEPTVEDVLDEFASAYDRIGGEDEEHQKYLNLIAEYAAKLMLRGDAE